MASNTIPRRIRKRVSQIKPSPRLVPTRPVDELRFRPGQHVEALCDHIRNGDRIRDWVQGVVVQADPKMVAVQFTEDVYLTDGWKIPDRILWFQQTTDHVRAGARKVWPKRRGRR